MMIEKLDSIDLKILQILMENGRRRRNEIAAEVGLSLPAVSERMKKMTDKGIIRGYSVILDAKRLGFDISAFITVNVDGSKYYESFTKAINETQHITECHSITGEGSHLLKIKVRNTSEIEWLLSKIQSWDGVHGTKTSIVLSTIKESSVIPLPD
ncbi:MAG: Lrp/AsnC family transcriptional regulator [Bacteroidetes bacterium]|nr:Lrp/AsnC family transcriptional regulator [Bacteroidota bacterium]